MTPNNLEPEHVDDKEPALPDCNDEDAPFFPEEEARNPAPTIPPLNQPPMNNNNPEIGARKGKMMEHFKECVNDSVKNRCWMEEDTQAGIELMIFFYTKMACFRCVTQSWSGT